MRTKNENNVYDLTCKVTGKVFKTNPKQFNATVARLGVDEVTLKANYVSRDGRRILRDSGLTAAQVSATYGVIPVVANQIKNLAKETPANIAVEVPADAEVTSPVVEAEPNNSGMPTPVESEAVAVA